MSPVKVFSPNATPSKAPAPIVCNPSFRVTFTSLVQPENAPFSMLTTVPGIVTLVILVLFLKTLLPIVFTSAGISTAPPVPLYLVSLPSVSIVKSDALNAAASSEASFSSSSSPSSSSSVSSDSISSSSAPSSPSGSDSPSDTSPSSGFTSSPVPSFSPGSVSSPSPVPSPGFFPSSSPVPSSDPVSPSFPVPSSDPVSPSSPVPSSDPVSPSSPVPSSDPVSPPVPVSSPDPVSPPVSVSSPDPVSLPVPLSSPDPEPASTPLSLSKVVSALISVADITPPCRFRHFSRDMGADRILCFCLVFRCRHLHHSLRHHSEYHSRGQQKRKASFHASHPTLHPSLLLHISVCHQIVLTDKYPCHISQTAIDRHRYPVKMYTKSMIPYDIHTSKTICKPYFYYTMTKLSVSIYLDT